MWALARPWRFLETLERLGMQVAKQCFFPDHHRFSPIELARVAQLAAQSGARVVTTEKDRVRLPPEFSA